MIEHSIEFSFKGGRDYVQGPDIYNGICEKLCNAGFKNMKISFHGMLKHSHCKLHVTDKDVDLENIPDIFARGIATVEGIQKHFALVENLVHSHERISHTYDEEVIRRKTIIVGQEAEFNAKSPYTFMETIVSLTKYLHQATFPDAEGKWIFTRLELDRNIERYESIRVLIKHNFHYRLTKSEIIVDNMSVGHIYFSLVKA